MKHWMGILAVLGMALMVGGCPKSGPGSNGPGSSGLSRDKVEDIQMMKMFLSDQGYRSEVDLRDVDQNGALDLYIKVLGGHPEQTPEQKLVNIGEIMGTIMAGCGYPIDQLYINIDAVDYRADFPAVAKCAWPRDEAAGKNRDECIKALFQK